MRRPFVRHDGRRCMRTPIADDADDARATSVKSVWPSSESDPKLRNDSGNYQPKIRYVASRS